MQRVSLCSGRVDVTIAGRKVSSKGTYGPEGLSQLVINGHLICLTHEGRHLFVESPHGGGSTYLLDKIDGPWMLAISSDGTVRTVFEPP